MGLFETENYRNFIRAYIKNLPKNGRGELGRIAEALLIDRTLLSQIMAGSREFTFEQAYELSRYLGLNEIETEYFCLLVQIERSGTDSLKKYLQKKLSLIKKEATKLSRRVSHQKTLSDTEKTKFYSSWIFSATHLFCSTNKNGVTLDDVSSRFSISKAQANEVLNFLVQTGICGESSGRYKIGVQSTFVEQGSPYLIKHHTNWRLKAIQKSEVLLDSELMFTAQMSLSKADFNILREKLAEFLSQVATRVKDSLSEDIACLNIDWFWIDK